MSNKYSRQQLVDAVNSPYDSKTTAEIFHVPASTIRRHRGESSLRSHVGRPSYFTLKNLKRLTRRVLSNGEELYFVSLLQLLPEYGFHVSREIALQLATEYCQSLGLSYRPGMKWLRLFMNQHANDIKWQREGKMERERAEGDWVIVDSRRRHIFESSGGSGKTFYTVLIAINAGGFVLVPYVLYSGKHLLDTWCRGGPNGAIYGVTDNIIKYYFKDGNKILRKSDFPRLLRKFIVEKSAFSPFRVVASFARSSIWSYDNQAMKNKVVQNRNSSSVKISTDEDLIPSNFIISNSQSTPSTHSSFSSSELLNSSLNQQPQINLQTSFVSSNDGRLFVSSNESTSLILPLPIQPTTFDDIPSPMNTTSYIDLQSSSPPRTCLIEKEENNKNYRNATDKLSMSNSPSTRPRGSRLKNTVGLNITDDEYLASKLKEKEEKNILISHACQKVNLQRLQQIQQQ
ncbi:unnamed protein product [Rotaria magnacalcarata]|uniref:Uncharacterized protein n=1 Tax=Rotaria magnacalcarata TaxID=392030 RepID=A0A816QXX5_9BILA|nr:unnamed protein product [Rotaria magnacalcarata]